MADKPCVTVKEGVVRGKINSDYQGNPYYSFQGIPYADVPIGDLRFKAPKPPKLWEGIRDGTKEGPECYSRHMIFKHITGSEDCLYLNVYTPELPSENTDLKPVMVWIHGGGFVAGSGSSDLYGPNFLISESVIIVTINYRLGILGFLSFDDPNLEVTGNAGLKDQVMALRWVQSNISKFGGDPNNVTLFGESAGAASIHYLILSPMAKGLFHKAIMQSSSAFCGWARGEPSFPVLVEALQLQDTTEKKVLHILQQMPVEQLFELQEKIPDKFLANFVRPFGPVIENVMAKNPFLTSEPLDIILSGNYNHVPIVMGFNSREGILSEIDCQRKYGELRFVTDFETTIPHVMKIEKGSNLSKMISEKIKNFYYGSSSPSHENVDQFYLMEGDNFFVWAVYIAAKQHCLTSHQPIYLYRMTVESSLNVYKKFSQIKSPGVCHGDDIGYLFTNALTPSLIPNSVEDKSVRRMKKLWTTFAKTGDPNPIARDDLINIHWKPVKPEEFHFLDIGDNLTVGINPECERMKFWQSIFLLSPHSCKL
ncbi:hypothetical protein RI129_002597 [Pyrocoelia pectoralis]|uniref:Carboxylic ester hydrolase n=1 Tax=Pyrocoelia pectoralis TaxID=417401 RepID=A0AAN7ZI19_9COLE